MSLPLRQSAGHLTGLQGTVSKLKKAVIGRLGAIRLQRQFAYNGSFFRSPRGAVVDEFYCTLRTPFTIFLH